MNLNRVGFVGWRGMVGSVLLQRMLAENDFEHIDEPSFFTTSQVGQPGPDVGRATPALRDATDVEALAGMDAIVSCQGGDYTKSVHGALRRNGWTGYWIDAASALRMNDDAIIVLDPVNEAVIERGLAAGCRDFIGGNCTVSLMLMALGGLLQADEIEWISAATYQAVSGAGARQMREVLAQMGELHRSAHALLKDPHSPVLDVEARATAAMRGDGFPRESVGHPLAGSLLPWIDADLGDGMSREEWKGGAEANKILDRGADPIAVESICVRIDSMRCHSQAFTIKLRRDLPIDEIEALLSGHNEWVSVVPNERQSSLTALTPARVSGTLDVPVGRLRKLALGEGFISAFTVGDQLLWGAAEPLRRMLGMLRAHRAVPSTSLPAKTRAWA